MSRNTGVSRKSDQRDGKTEDNLVLVSADFTRDFPVYRYFGIIVHVHELFTLKHANACLTSGQRGFPARSIATIHVSHVLLALNSAVNILIYCGLNSKFREEFMQLFTPKETPL